MIKRFNRLEFKYIIDIHKAEKIIEDILHKSNPDTHGGMEGYPISSLYYDSPDLDCFWNKIEGLKYRRKIRIRVYPKTSIDDIDINEAMIEIKQRINRTVQKRRLKLTLEQAYRLCAGDYTERNLDPTDEQVASEIEYLVKSMDLRPSCIIDYHRKAFTGTLYNPGLRITFDTELKYRKNNLELDQNSESHYFLSPDLCIMEVKVNDVIPDWVTSVLAKHNCQIQRISKYCASIAIANKIPVMSLAVSTKNIIGGVVVE